MQNLPVLMRSSSIIFLSTLVFSLILTILFSSIGLDVLCSPIKNINYYLGILLLTCIITSLITVVILFDSITLTVFVGTLIGSFVLTVLISSTGFDILFSPIENRYFYLGILIFSLIVTGIISLCLLLKCIKLFILFLVFAFLYLPMLMLVIYSFNSSRLVTVWAGFSTHWYSELVTNVALHEAVGLSLLIAFASATVAVILGTLASYTIVRFGKFKGVNLFSFMTTAPLVMPDVITGLALLLLFVAMGHFLGWPQDRGAITIWLAHVTFCTAYVTVVVSARLRELDKSIEEAAMDLGANPLKVFFIITLPMIAPALVSGWLLAFTLSLDDLVISSFVAGPGATTLPMLIFSKVRLGVSPDINALASIIILIVSVIGFISWLLMRRAEKRRLQEMRNIKYS